MRRCNTRRRLKQQQTQQQETNRPLRAILTPGGELLEVEYVASMAGTPGSFNKAAADDLVHRIPGRQNFTDAPALVQEGITSSGAPLPHEPL